MTHTSGESAIWRLLVLPLQIVIPGAIGVYLASMILLALQAVAPPARKEVPLIAILGGLVIAFPVWLFGLLVDRFSLLRLALTAALSILGLTVSYLLVEFLIWAPHWLPRPLLESMWLLLICAVLAAPLAGAMAGYYTPWRRPYLWQFPQPRWFKGLVVVVCTVSVAIVPVAVWLALAWINRK